MSVLSVCGEHISCFCIGVSDESGGLVRYPYQGKTAESPTKRFDI